MPEISIILPSLRQEALFQRVREFSLACPDVDYEIIVVSPFEVKMDRVVHIFERDRKGCIHAHGLAYHHASGEYIVPWSDDASPTVGCLDNMLKFMKGKRDPFIASFRIKNKYHYELSPWRVYGRLYACWACVSRRTLDMVGGYYDPVFRSYWADPDLSLRVITKGGKIGTCRNTWVILQHINDKVRADNFDKYFKPDTDTFISRWHHQYGQGYDRGEWKNFNTEVPPSRWKKLSSCVGSALSCGKDGVRRGVAAVLSRFGILPSEYAWRNPFKIYEYQQLVGGAKLEPSDEVLDFGCGSGRQACLLAKRSRRVVGVDVSPSEIEKAGLYAFRYGVEKKVEFRCGQIEKLDLGRECFDKIFSFSVLEHVPNYEEALGVFLSVLKPGGSLIMSVDSLAPIADNNILEQHRDDHSVLRYFTPQELETLLTRLGYRHVEITSLFTSRYAVRLFERSVITGFNFHRWKKFVAYWRLAIAERFAGASGGGIFLCVRAIK